MTDKDQVRQHVFPTRVGVNRIVSEKAKRHMSFPHPRGGEPLLEMESNEYVQFSPPAWG